MYVVEFFDPSNRSRLISCFVDVKKADRREKDTEHNEICE